MDLASTKSFTVVRRSSYQTRLGKRIPEERNKLRRQIRQHALGMERRNSGFCLVVKGVSS